MGIQPSVSSSGGSCSENIQGTIDQSLKDSVAIGMSGISHDTTGSVDLDESHFVFSKAGEYAEIGIKIAGVPETDPYSYHYELYPGEGGGKNADHVTAIETLNAPVADYIKAYSRSRNSLGYVSAVSTEVTRTVDTAAALLLYHSNAAASANGVESSQGFESASGSVKADTGSFLWGSKNVPNGQASDQWSKIRPEAVITTAAAGIFTDYSDSSVKSSDSAEAAQGGHISGTFTSIASAMGASPVTRTSNYGTGYDLDMKASKGSAPSGTLGYFVDPSMANLIPGKGALQGAVISAHPGDTINAAAGEYRDNIQVDKSLTIKGSDKGVTKVDGNKAGSVFTVAPGVILAMSYLTITNGLAARGSGIYNNGGTVIMNNGCTVSQNNEPRDQLCVYGGGIYNKGGTVIMNYGSSGRESIIGCY